MPILNFPSLIPGQNGNAPRIIQMKCNDNFQTVTAINYLYPTIVQGFSFLPTDIFFIAYGENSDTFGIFTQYIQPGTVTLQLYQPAPTLYAVDQLNTLSISRDGGVTWRQSSSPTGSNISNVFDQGNVLYVTTGDDNVAISTNNGSTWYSVPTSPPSAPSAIWVTPEGIIYIGCINSNIYISPDGGVTWTRTAATPGTVLVYNIVVKNGIIYAVTGTFIGQGYLYFSSNGGASWTTNHTTPDGTALTDIAVTPQGYVYGSTLGGNVGLSYSNGFVWIVLPPPGNTNGSEGIALTANGILYTAGPPTTLVFSHNNGRTWNITSPFVTGVLQKLVAVTTNYNA